MKQINLLDIPVNLGTYDEFINNIIQSAKEKKQGYACAANVHTLVESQRNKHLSKGIWHANYIAPDGKPLTWALKLIYGIKQDRIAGMDLLPSLVKAAADNKVPIYFYGGAADALEHAQKYMREHFPDLIIKGAYSPPFRELTNDEENDVVKRINSSRAELVFVILGCPKQENWMSDMSDRINAFMIGLGGALPVMIGMQKRAPVWMQKTGFEWLYRLSQEPKRLFKRYAVTNTVFFFLLIKKLISYKWQRQVFTIFESN